MSLHPVSQSAADLHAVEASGKSWKIGLVKADEMRWKNSGWAGLALKHLSRFFFGINMHGDFDPLGFVQDIVHSSLSCLRGTTIWVSCGEEERGGSIQER